MYLVCKISVMYVNRWNDVIFIVGKIVLNNIISRLSESKALVNSLMTTASQVSNKSLDVAANINVTETNMHLTNSNIEEINEIG